MANYKVLQTQVGTYHKNDVVSTAQLAAMGLPEADALRVGAVVLLDGDGNPVVPEVTPRTQPPQPMDARFEALETAMAAAQADIAALQNP